MKRIGSRLDPPLNDEASGEALAQGARFSETLAGLAPSTFIPKGVYRFRTHEEANRHQDECLVRGMAELARQRR